MRFKLVLQRSTPGRFIPLNYQYAISSWIYRRIELADPDYSHFLHGQGYANQNRKYKLFTFGPLETYPYQIRQDRMEMKSDFASIVFSFVADQAAENFIKGIFTNQVMQVKDPVGGVTFEIIRVETLPREEFKQVMTYQLKTPLCISHKGVDDKHPQYLSPDHPQFADILLNNLVRKFAALQTAQAGGIMPQPDNEFKLDFKLQSRVKEKLLLIKSYTDHETRVKGYQFRFQLQAPVELQELGYYAGFGEKNSMGMGFGRGGSK
ncbi:MAG: CRISPR-associated endoribonuclease Cas6 [Candidatus Cyclobacteriaceae bacterium M3_2C_046]